VILNLQAAKAKSHHHPALAKQTAAGTMTIASSTELITTAAVYVLRVAWALDPASSSLRL
jgi:hypothetical protein